MDITKYNKLLAMGMPRQHVELKMMAEGLDPALLSIAPNSPNTSIFPPASPPKPSLSYQPSPPSPPKSINMPQHSISPPASTPQTTSPEPPNVPQSTDSPPAPVGMGPRRSVELTLDTLKDVELTIPKADSRPGVEKMFTIELGGKTLSSVATSLKDRHRRWMQKMLISFGSVTPSPDAFYTREKERFLGLLKSIQDIRGSLAHYKAMLPQYCLACAQLGVDVWCVVSADAVGQNVAAEKFRHAMCAINEKQEIKSHFFNADAVLDGAIRFVEIHIRTMESYKFLMDEREVFKLDYDSYERALQRAHATKRTSQEIDKLQAKVTAARVKLDDATTCLYRVFAKYESERNTMLNGELEMVRQVMHTFYLKSCQVTDFTIQSQVDGEAIAKKERELFENMRKYGLILSEVPSPTKPSAEIIDNGANDEWNQQLQSYRLNCPKLPELKTRKS